MSDTQQDFRVENRPQEVDVEWQLNVATDKKGEYWNSPCFEIFGIDAEWHVCIELCDFKFIVSNCPLVSLHLVKRPSQTTVHVRVFLDITIWDGDRSTSHKDCDTYILNGDAWRDGFEIPVISNPPEVQLKIFCNVSVLDCENITAREMSVPKVIPASCFRTLFRNYRELYTSGYQHDVKFKVKDKRFVAHRSVLVAQSPVFRSMLELLSAEEKNDEITIEDCNPESFENFLLFIYSGDSNAISAYNSMDLYLIADKFYIPELKKACSKCLADEMSIALLFDVIPFAAEHDESELFKTATEFFIKNYEEVLESAKWQTFLTNHFALAEELLSKWSTVCEEEQIRLEPPPFASKFSSRKKVFS